MDLLAALQRSVDRAKKGRGEAAAPPSQDDADEPEEPEEKPKPTASGEANQPKTDVDISGTGSLFDL